MQIVANTINFGSHKSNCSELYSFSKPVKLRKALQEICNGQLDNNKYYFNELVFRQYINDFNNEKIGRRKINKILGAGQDSIAFETPAGDVLKISRTNPFIDDRPIQDFDAKIFKRGKHNKSYYLIEEKLNDVSYDKTSNDLNPIKQIVQKIIEKGFKPIDIGQDQLYQIGKSKDGVIKLRDHGCAIYKSNIQKRIYEIKRMLLNLFQKIL